VKEYENAVENIGEMSEWDRTTNYWSRNLGVANLYVLGAPAYTGLQLKWWGSYISGINIAYWHHLGGANFLLAFFAMIFMHGILELTGIFIIAAATARLAWNFWKGLAHMMQTAQRSGSFWSWGLSKRERRELRKHKRRIKGFMLDFLILVLIGELLIFFAAPIEAYVSPWVFAAFYWQPWLALIWLAAIAFFYVSVFFVGLRGFKRMKRDAGMIYKDLKFALKGKWRASLLPLVMFIAFSALLTICLIA
jgi:uncharacterized membrane protein SpoIIM required for sporulation